MTEHKQITKEMIQKELLRLSELLNDPTVSQAQYLKEKEKLNDMLKAFQQQSN